MLTALCRAKLHYDVSIPFALFRRYNYVVRFGVNIANRQYLHIVVRSITYFRIFITLSKFLQNSSSKCLFIFI